MTVELLQALLGWSGLINMGILLLWFLLIFTFPDWIYEIHRKFYPISRESFNNIH